MLKSPVFPPSRSLSASPLPARPWSNRRILPALAAATFALLLTACSALPDKPSARPAVYDFGPGPIAAAAMPSSSAAASTPTVPVPALTLEDIDAPDALDGTAILYRLSYADVQQLRPYAQARWSMTPAQLVRQRLREQLGLQRVVLNRGDVPGSTVLSVELEEFSQVFERADRSVGVVRLRATLVESTGGRERLSAQRSFAVQRPAPSANAQGGVRALTAATDAAVQEVAQWLQQLGKLAR